MRRLYLCRDGAAVPWDGQSAVHERRGVFVAWVVASHLLLARDAASGIWDLPGGGVKPGESDLSALRRELREETSLCLEDAGEVQQFTKLMQSFYARRRSQFWRYDMRLFLARGLRAGHVYQRPIAGGESRWVSHNAIDRLMVNAVHRRMIAASLEMHSAHDLPARIRDPLRAASHAHGNRASDAQWA